MDYNSANNMTAIQLPENVTSNVLEYLAESISELYRKDKNVLRSVFLDFSKIKYIEIEGALTIICFCAAIKRKNPNANFNYIYPSENVFSYLLNLGFFSQMCSKAGVMDRPDIVHYENELKKERKNWQKDPKNISRKQSVILPIETIVEQMNSVNERDFEHLVGKFANSAIDAFDILLTSPYYNFNGDDYYQFRQSNIELYKNIFHHSKSWGIATIHARPNYGTTVCYYDIGIGFKASVNRFKTEVESIEWALIDGNTSKPNGDNDGYGFTLIQEFVFRRNGRIKIRSGDCQLILNSTTKKENIIKSSFPGAQISYFIPA